jgi:uncharacterized membrane protein YvbJ
MSDLKCGKCGENWPSGTTFCGSCGTAIVETQVDRQANGKPKPMVEKKTRRKTPSFKKLHGVALRKLGSGYVFLRLVEVIAYFGAIYTTFTLPNAGTRKLTNMRDEELMMLCLTIASMWFAAATISSIRSCLQKLAYRAN